ncbi:MAG: PIN domain-containing protein [Bacteroidetes bacterium]|jgi:ribonuclease VapC|nr:PIN domain-containing protein [Bacteroidota bacterium]
MVLDTSAVIAILLDEPEADRMVKAVDAARLRRLSAASLLEAGIVIQSRLGTAGEEELDLLLNRMQVETMAITEEHANLARSAYRRFGKGRHPAALNYGDCFSYALAAALQEPLMFKGNDFGHTDIIVAAY